MDHGTIILMLSTKSADIKIKAAVSVGCRQVLGLPPMITKCLGELAAVYWKPDHSPAQSHHRVEE